MNNQTVLNLGRLPARITAAQVAELLGFAEHEVPILMRSKLLKPLGDPAQNGHKFFCAYEIEALSKQRDWLNVASKAVTKFRRAKNGTGEAQKQSRRANECALP